MIAPPMIVVTDHAEDLLLAQQVGRRLDVDVLLPRTPQEAARFLMAHPETLTIWDGDSDEARKTLIRLKQQKLPVQRTVVITSGPLQEYAGLREAKTFAHHCTRRIDPSGINLWSGVLKQALRPFPFGLKNYLPSGCKVNTIRPRRASHKNPAVEAVRSFLLKQKASSRMANLAARAVDEFLMNALFDAPIQADGTRYRKNQSRQADFEVQGEIEVSVANAKDFLALSVADGFGSLDRAEMLELLTRDYRRRAYEPREEAGAGLGIHELVSSGISLALVCRPRMRTEVMAFLPNPYSFKEFRKSFRFLSVMGGL